MLPISAAAVSLFGAPLGTTASSTPVSAAYGVAPAGIGAVPETAGLSTPFGDLLVESVGQVDLLERQARSSVEGLISGKGVDVHEAMIATEKSEMGFELLLSVRNKALAAYQQVMGMQF